MIKHHTISLLKKISVFLFINSIYVSNAYALPVEGVNDNFETADITKINNSIVVKGKNKNNIINWQTFSLDENESIIFTDDNNYLNLVTGVDTSKIYGAISGGNQVYIVNPYGCTLAENSSIQNTKELIISTRDLSDIGQASFIADTNDIKSVLYSDSNESRNKDYYPENSPYVPTISIAEININNDIGKNTELILDGPRGVILKEPEMLEKIKEIRTNYKNGELGIGSKVNGRLLLSNEQSNKIKLINNTELHSFNENSTILHNYKTITSISELQNMDETSEYILGNNINGSKDMNFIPIPGVKKLDGLGYTISDIVERPTHKPERNHAVDNYNYGLFETITGTVKNLNLKNIIIDTTNWNDSNIPYEPIWNVGGLVGNMWGGNISNITVSGLVCGDTFVGGIAGNVESIGNGLPEIRNCTNKADVVMYGGRCAGGIAGQIAYGGNLFLVSNTGYISTIGFAKNFDWGHGKFITDEYSGSEVGGIVGRIGQTDTAYNKANSKCRILSAYNKGKVEGRRFVGGIVGINCGYIGNCYNFSEDIHLTSNVSSSAPLYGLILGANAGTIIREVKDDYSHTFLTVPPDIEYFSSSTGERFSSYSFPDKNGLYNTGTKFGVSYKDKEELAKFFNYNWASGKTNITPRDNRYMTSNARKQYSSALLEILSNAKKSLNSGRIYNNDMPNNPSPIFREINLREKNRIINYTKQIFANASNVNEIINAGNVVIKVLDKSLDSDVSNVSADYANFIYNMYIFMNSDKKGLNGAANLSNLTASSFDMYKTLFNAFKKMDVNKKNQVLQNVEFVHSFGVVSSILGLTGSLLSATNNISDKEAYEITADYVDCFNDIFNIEKEFQIMHIETLGKENIDALEKAGVETGSLNYSMTTRNGLWTPLDVYSAICEATVRSGAQLIRSVGKYSKDGNWDLNDTAETALDVSMAGIYGISHSLSFGADDLIFGTIDKWTGGTHPEMSYIEKAAEGYKIFARRQAEKIHDWFVNS